MSDEVTTAASGHDHCDDDQGCTPATTIGENKMILTAKFPRHYPKRTHTKKFLSGSKIKRKGSHEDNKELYIRRERAK